MNVIGMYPNIKRDIGLCYTKEAVKVLRAHPVLILLPQELKQHWQGDASGLEFVPEEELFSRSDCLVTLGGDGTILSVADCAAEADLPIFGINLGRVGFMATVEKKEIAKIDCLMTGNFSESSRMLLSCYVNGKEEMRALNEFVIAPERGIHMIELSLFADRKRLCDFRADGLIFNTPNGSTGYSFSAGGAVVDAEFDSIGVKAVSSYLLINAHHMIFSPETVFTAKNIQSDGSSVSVCADGRQSVLLSPDDTVKICRSKKRVRLITVSKRSNLEVFFRKF